MNWVVRFKRGYAMDFVVSGYTQHDIRRMRLILDEIKAKRPGETDERIVAMALSRMYDDIVQPQLAEEPPTDDELRGIGAVKPNHEELRDGLHSFARVLQKWLQESEAQKASV